MNERLNNLAARGKEMTLRLSQREKLILVGAVVLIVLMAGSKIYDFVDNALALQRVELERAESELNAVGVMLQRHAKLKARRDEIETMYKEIDIKEGGLSLIERLLRTKASVTSGFTIKDGPVRQFGGNYEQAPFSVKFPISSLANLIALLDELVHGPQRMVLTKLDIKKARGSDRLDVEIDVSSFKKIK